MPQADSDFWDDAPAEVGLKNGVYGLRSDKKFYIYPPPPGVDLPKGWQGWKRMTNLVGAFSDQKQLQEWMEWKVLMGFRAEDGLLVDEWMAESVEQMDEDDQRAIAKKYGELARMAADSMAAARRGTARHLMMDSYLQRGEVVGTRSMQAQRVSAMEALDRCNLEPIDSEFRVWHPAAGGTIGTSDCRVLCRRTGQVGILDWKTQARFWTFQEICGQLAGYADAPWVWVGPNTDEGRWVEQEPSTLMGHPDGEFPGRPVALVAHMPKGPGPDQLPVEILEVPLDYGRRVIELAAQVTELRSIGKSVALGRRVGAYRPEFFGARGLARRAIAG